MLLSSGSGRNSSEPIMNPINTDTTPNDCRAEEDNGTVFSCTKCRLPVGDSVAWMGSDEQENTILLKSVTEHVVMGKEQKVFQTPQYGCIYVNLSCSGCSLELGRVYKCTPKKLDFKRDLYCLNVASLDSYVLGATESRIPEDEPLCIETRCSLQREMEKTNTVVAIIEKKLAALEAHLNLRSPDVNP